MSYAKDRTYLDADSHLMELPDSLTAHADPAIRDRIPRLISMLERGAVILGKKQQKPGLTLRNGCRISCSRRWPHCRPKGLLRAGSL